MTDDAKEREHAKRAAKVGETVATSDAEWPMHRELISLRARAIYAQYAALVKQGFTEAQALGICWRY